MKIRGNLRAANAAPAAAFATCAAIAIEGASHPPSRLDTNPKRRNTFIAPRGEA